MEQQIQKALIRKFIAGNCTAEEQEYIKILMQQSGSQELFDQVLDEDWQVFKKEAPATDDYIWNFQQRLNRKLDDAVAKPDRSIRRNNFYRYAAIWAVLIVGIAAYGMFHGYADKTAMPVNIAMLSSYNPNGQRSKITLSDGSVVTLGAGSRLNYPEQFADSIREISLEGEAFFEITKNPKKPFIIHTGEVQTKVLGTSFKIDAFKGQDITVAVATGKVQVDRKSAGSGKLESLALLLPGDLVEWNPATGIATKGEGAEAALTGWKSGKLSFTGTPLREVVAVLERWYDVSIEIRNKEIGAYKMNLILDGTQPLQQSLDILKATTKVGYKIKGKTVIIQ